MLFLVRSNPLKPTERYCFKASSGNIAVRCRGDGCMAFVNVPIRKYRVGGKESHEWKGCMYVLVALAKVSKSCEIPLDDLLSLNR